MEEQKLVSVVIPIYNVEKFLRACVDSVLNQTYTNLEIILVDDGSPDECPEICDEYQAQDSRIKVIHKENGGLSDARNIGLEAASGSYITFMDSDDYVDKNFIEVLYGVIVQYDAQIAMCDYRNVGEGDNETFLDQKKGCDVYSNLECLRLTYISGRHGMEFVAWGKLYDIALFRNSGITYPKGKLHEDTFTTYKLYYEAEKIVFADLQAYNYRIRSGSIMTNAFNIRRLDSITATKEMCEFFVQKERSILAYSVNMHLKTCLKMYYDLDKNYKGSDKRRYMDEVIGTYRVSLGRYASAAKLGFFKMCFYRMVSICHSIKLIQYRYKLR